MEGIVNKEITVSSLSQKQTSFGSSKFIIESVGANGRTEKYYFFDTKRAGGETAAYAAFCSMGVRIGDKLSVGVKEEEKSFVGKEGTEIKYTDRRIVTIEGNKHAA